MDLWLIIVSPLIVTTLCGAFYVIEALRTGIGFKFTLETFLRYLILWAMIGFGIAFLVVLFHTAFYNSPQGPLAFILYGPLGIAIGELLGVMKWRLRVAKRNLTASS
jgi:hypothetical protein